MRISLSWPSQRRLVPRPRRLLAVLGPDTASAGQSLTALAINSSTSLVAGAILGSITGTLEQFPGLLVMVPAAIGLRGNIFSALGSRVSTSVHTGEYRQTLRADTVLGDNVAASLSLSMLLAVVLAVLADVVATVLGIDGAVDVLDLITISFLGGLMASAVVLAATLALVIVAVRRSWDLDNLVAPVVSTLGDVVTVPALWLASLAAGHQGISEITGTAAVVISVIVLLRVWRSQRVRLRRIIRESLPILAAAALVSTLAGLVLEHQLTTFHTYPALLILVPAFVSSAGALGGLLSNSLGTRLHLGVVTASPIPSATVRNDVRLLATLAFPVYLFNGVGAHVVAVLLDQPSPGLGSMIEVSLLGAIGAFALAAAVAYYGTITAVAFRADPDTYGVPIVTSTVDFLGAGALIAAVTILALA